MNPGGILDELAPTVVSLYERHLSMAKEWFPHQMVQWSRGQDYDPEWTWSAGDFQTTKAVRSALFLNLLTEDNLPFYTLALHRTFSADGGIWGEWSRRWTSEEDRHSTVIRDWIHINRVIDPVALERARMKQIGVGYYPDYATNALEGLVYVSLQELATRIAHHNTGKHIEDPAGKAILTRVAADENLHFLFYRDLATVALELDPNAMMPAMARMVKTFEMPGTGIPGFEKHSYNVALAKIFDYTQFHDQVLVPVVLRHWKIESLTGLDDGAERARDEILAHMALVAEMGERFSKIRPVVAPQYV